MAKLHIRKNDTVMVLAGEDKGKTGKVLKVLVEKQRAIVEGVNMVSKSTKPSAKNPQGGIVKQSQGRRLSNGKYSTIEEDLCRADCSGIGEAVQLQLKDAGSRPEEDCSQPRSW